MSTPGSSVTLVPHLGADPESCTEHGYGLGRPDGILVVKYRTAGALEFGESRQDFLHQLYWSPDGILSARTGSELRFLGAGEAFWAPRGVRHEVHAPDWQTVYRVCLRQVPPALDPHYAGSAAVDGEAARLIAQLARNGQDEAAALIARSRIMAGLAALPTGVPATGTASGAGYALAVARALALDPADDSRLDEWAERLHLSVKTLQRDFTREYGISFTQFRTALRLRAARALLGSLSVGAVAHRVGYASPSAFVAAFTREHGYTPGTHAAVSSSRAPGA